MIGHRVPARKFELKINLMIFLNSKETVSPLSINASEFQVILTIVTPLNAVL